MYDYETKTLDLTENTWSLSSRNNKAKEYSERCRKKKLDCIYNTFISVLIVVTLCFVCYCFMAVAKQVYI